jgi:dephospho-CoA kinase
LNTQPSPSNSLCRTWIVTGGIATGKSLVCARLRAALPQGLFFSADASVHEAYEDVQIARRIADLAGIEGELRGAALRQELRRRLGLDKSLKAGLEAILHPHVWLDYEKRAAQAMAAGAEVLVAEIPLYYETGAKLAADRVIVIAASRATQLDRLRSDRGLSVETASDFLQMQMPLEHKIQRADVVIWNDGSQAALDAQLELLR